MPLVREAEVDDYWPMYGALYVKDVREPDRAGPPVGELLAEGVVRTSLGSMARAGDGWLMDVANDCEHVVRIEVHDGPPPADDLSRWDAVIETPYASSGVAGLNVVSGGPVGEPVVLGRPGLYRARCARRPRFPGSGPIGVAYRYRLQFWPVDAPPEPPQVLRRRDVVGGDRPGAVRDPNDTGYHAAVADVVALLLWAAEATTPVTLSWLADRLLTSAATIRTVLEHPAAGLLVVAGDLDDAEAPLTITIHEDSIFPNARPRGGFPTRAAPAPAPASAAARRAATKATAAGRPKIARQHRRKSQ
ncbi:hypothetical protein [Rugosimonospora africana]|uniref:Uncharacterized protein n=1 Tax=Rugosimonospora africana TaxID=556532 RepID=A0A8J3QRZ6_9ACTN|nr:hypothetical protein [Rugosimonospora africana]GIH15197.1 hypothetical protein Raf01_33690 [Rugosimonospora africana]